LENLLFSKGLSFDSLLASKAIAWGTFMNITQLTAFAAAYVAATLLIIPAFGQDQNPITNRDVLTQPVTPAPENGDIILKFGDSTRIYFKHPIKLVKLEDELSVRAVPQTDHIVKFTGLAPGRSSITVESTDGRSSSWDLVTVVREPHEIKMYVPSPSARNGGNRSGITIMDNGNNGITSQTSDSADYQSVLCNEVSCTPPPPPAK
jgi:hypothetical protein